MNIFKTSNPLWLLKSIRDSHCCLSSIEMQMQPNIQTIRKMSHGYKSNIRIVLADMKRWSTGVNRSVCNGKRVPFENDKSQLPQFQIAEICNMACATHRISFKTLLVLLPKFRKSLEIVTYWCERINDDRNKWLVSGLIRCIGE